MDTKPGFLARIAGCVSRSQRGTSRGQTDESTLARREIPRACACCNGHPSHSRAYFLRLGRSRTRRLLPSLSPELIATAIWGPVLSWCVLELLAESIDAEKPERAALDLFDRLRLREPLAHSFLALGFKGEESWRAAARIKVALLVEAGVCAPEASGTMALPERAETVPTDGVAASATATSAAPAKAPGEQKQATPALSPILWHDADVRWLTGVHEAHGHTYFVKESYEELIWWLQLPVLSKLAGEAVPDRSAIAELSKAIKEALEAAASADYSLDALLESDKPEAEAR